MQDNFDDATVLISVKQLANRPEKIKLMNNLKNRVQLIGHLGMTPEIVSFDKGKKVAKFSLATNDYYSNENGEKVQNTEWHTIVAWNRTAEFVEKYLDKGKQVALEGKLATRSWEDKEGKKRYSTEVICSEIHVFGPKEKSN